MPEIMRQKLDHLTHLTNSLTQMTQTLRKEIRKLEGKTDGNAR